MRAGRLYRHPHCLDIDLQVVKIQFVGPTYIKVKVRYWYRAGKAFIPHAAATYPVKIQRSDLGKWREVTEDGEFV